MFHCKGCLHISFILVDFCICYSERPNLQLYRGQVCCPQGVALRSYTVSFRERGLLVWPSWVSWYILMQLRHNWPLLPCLHGEPWAAMPTSRHLVRVRRQAMQCDAGLDAASLKALWTLQYCVMAWEFILNTASSGEGKVLATRMGASATCKMRNHDH